MEATQSSFEGWAVIDQMGHTQEMGFVTTEYFGGPALFRVDRPEMPAREHIIDRPQWIGDTMVGAGTKVQREAVPGFTVFLGPSSIFKMRPCSEETVRAQMERSINTPIKILNLVEPPKALTGRADDEYED